MLCMHFQCVAHILRELTYIHEVMDQEWAKDMKDLLLEAKDLRDQGKRSIPQSTQSDRRSNTRSDSGKINGYCVSWSSNKPRT